MTVEAGATLPIDIRRPTAQLVRLEIYQWMGSVPLLAMFAAVEFPFTPSWPSPWIVAAYAAMFAVALGIDVRRRRREVLRLTEDGLYAGRDDGKKLGWLGQKPMELPWGIIRNVRVVETRWSRKVFIDNTGYTRELLFPVSTWANPDPELDDRVALIRRTWEAERGPLPPPPAPPLFLPTVGPPPTPAGR